MNLKLKVLKRSEWNPGAIGLLMVLAVLLYRWVREPDPVAWPGWFFASLFVLVCVCVQGRTRVEVVDDERR